VPTAVQPTPPSAVPCNATEFDSHHCAVVPIERAVDDTLNTSGDM
jgi:hypothetical protein